jgi:hypothetical protein
MEAAFTWGTRPCGWKPDYWADYRIPVDSFWGSRWQHATTVAGRKPKGV